MHFDTRAYVEPITLGIRVPRIFEPGEFEECCRYDDWQAEKAFSDMADQRQLEFPPDDN